VPGAGGKRVSRERIVCGASLFSKSDKLALLPVVVIGGENFFRIIYSFETLIGSANLILHGREFQQALGVIAVVFILIGEY
jgi:hypothetical protein